MLKLWLLVRVMLKGEKLASSGFNLNTSKRRRGLFSRKGFGIQGDGASTRGASRKIMAVLIFLMMIGLFTFYGYSLGRLLLQVEPFMILILRVVALYISVFSIFNIVTLLYYSEELPFYLSLPLSKGTLVGAKLIHATIYNVLMILGMIVWPLFIGLGIKLNLSWSYYLSAILLSLLIALSAQAIISSLLVIVMRFTKFAKNKDRFTMVFSVLMILFILGFSMAPSLMSSSMENLSIADEQRALTNVMQMTQDAQAINIVSSLFAPPLLLIGKLELWHNGVLPLTTYLFATLITLALCLLLFVVAHRFYTEGAMAVQGSGGKKKGRLSEDKVSKGLRKRSPFLALVKKDWLVLRRTPSYFTNYLMPIFIVPVFMIITIAVPVLMSQNQMYLSDIKTLIEPLVEYWRDPIISSEITRFSYIILMGIMAFTMSMNTLSISMISREGRSAYLMKMMPQSYMLQIRSKLFLGSLIGIMATILFFIAILFLLKAPWYISLTFCLIYFSETYLPQVLDGLMDISFPRLDWSQDIEVAKRQGLTFASFALGFLIIAAKIAAVYFFSQYVSKDPPIVTIFVVVLYLVTLFAAELLLRTYTQRKMESMVI